MNLGDSPEQRTRHMHAVLGAARKQRDQEQAKADAIAALLAANEPESAEPDSDEEE